MIATEEPERAAALYGARLGLDMTLDLARPDWGARLMFFRCGDLVVEIVHHLNEASRGNPDKLWGLSWRVADIDAAQARLAAAGLDVSEIRTGRRPGTRVFTVRTGALGVPTLVIQPAARDLIQSQIAAGNRERSWRQRIDGFKDENNAYEAWLAAEQCDVDEKGLKRKAREDERERVSVSARDLFPLGDDDRGALPEFKDAPKVLAVGDMHIENFGTWRNVEAASGLGHQRFRRGGAHALRVRSRPARHQRAACART